MDRLLIFMTDGKGLLLCMKSIAFLWCRLIQCAKLVGVLITDANRKCNYPQTPSVGFPS